MRRFVNEALVQLNALSEHVTTWMAEEPDHREGDADKLTARQWVLVHAGYIRGALEAGLAAADVTDPSADLTAAVAHVRELEAEVQHSHDERDALRAKLGEAEKLSESWRSRIATAVGAVHEWDHGSAPGTWEQIEDKAASDRKQADATLDEAITYRDKCELMQNRITDLEEEARDAESRLTRYAALERAARRYRAWAKAEQTYNGQDKALDTALAALDAPAADRKVLGIDPARRCGECSKYRSDGYCADIDACVGGGDDVCGSFTRRMPETLVAVATEVGNG
jgi:hypothetical protein